MQVYLPIAEISVDFFLLIALGGGVGVISGLFGVGGGFLITPLLIVIGVPPAVAVATGANQVAGSSLSGVLVHWRRRTVDYKMGLVLLAGGLIGAALGVQLFAFLRALGQVELVVSLCYVVMLGAIGAMMLVEGVQALRRSRAGVVHRRRHSWIHRLPIKTRFRASNLYISVIPPFVVGAFVGLLSAVMGVGGGFIMVPAMIYILGMATNVVVGTSLFQILFVSAATTLMHAIESRTVDFILAVMLLLGGVVGAQIGARLAPKLNPEQMRVAMAVLVLAVCVEIGLGLVRNPGEVFVVVAGHVH